MEILVFYPHTLLRPSGGKRWPPDASRPYPLADASRYSIIFGLSLWGCHGDFGLLSSYSSAALWREEMASRCIAARDEEYMERPKYLGSTSFIHAEARLSSYFTTTTVADWDLAAFLLSGGDVESFVSTLERINDTKTVNRDIRKHAWTLLRFFSIEQHVAIATNQVEQARNRLTLQGYEHREVQEDLRSTFEGHLAKRRCVTQAQPRPSLLASGTSPSALSMTGVNLTADISHPAPSLPTDNIRSSTPSPTSIPTESQDSPPVYTAGQERDPFQACEDDDEDEDGNAGAGEENDVLLPDNTDQAFRFSAMLDGIDVAIGFQSLFIHIRKTKVYIDDIDQALARSGVILLGREGAEIQKLHFGEKTLFQMREKALTKWQDTEAMTCRNQVRAWLDPHEDLGYDRTKSLKHISESAPLDSKHQKLWTFLMAAVQEFPESDSTKGYSESTVDSTTESGRSRIGSRSRKEPDLALEIKDGSNKIVCEVGFGEVTSHAQKSYKKKNAKDLVRIGLSLKDALDFIGDSYGVHDAVLVGWQVVGQIMAIYLMFKCGNLYILIHVRDVTIPDNLTELGTISTQIKVWDDLKATIEQGLSPVFEAVASGKRRAVGSASPLGPTLPRIETTRTPEFKTFLNRLILEKLCPKFTVEDIANGSNINDGTTEDFIKPDN
ncbi:hypothetical protein BGZ47_006159, partial [Haplosporangium gracile]